MSQTNDFRDSDALSLFPAENEAASTSDAVPAAAADADVETVQLVAAAEPVPPPAASDVDALLEAVSAAGRSPIQEFRSELDAPSEPAPSPVGESAAFFIWRPAIVRWVLPSAAAFLIGALSVLGVLRTLRPASYAPPETLTVAGERRAPAMVSPPLVAIDLSPLPAAIDMAPPTLPPPVIPSLQPVSAGVPYSVLRHLRQTRVAMPSFTVGTSGVTRSAALTKPPVPSPSATPSPRTTPAQPALTARTTPAPAPSSATRAPLTAGNVDERRAKPLPSPPNRRPDPPALAPLNTAPATNLEGLRAADIVPEAPRPVAPPPVAAATFARLDASVEEYAVRRALHSYEAAYDDMDVAAAVNIWPSVDRGALARAFGNLKSQGLDFQTCTITVADANATALCRGTLQFVRKVGNPAPLTAEQQWIFKMRRAGAEWKIDNVSSSQSPELAAQRVRGQG